MLPQMARSEDKAYLAGILDSNLTDDVFKKEEPGKSYLQFVVGPMEKELCEMFRLFFGGAILIDITDEDLDNPTDVDLGKRWSWLVSNRTAIQCVKELGPFLKTRQLKCYLDYPVDELEEL